MTISAVDWRIRPDENLGAQKPLAIKGSKWSSHKPEYFILLGKYDKEDRTEGVRYVCVQKMTKGDDKDLMISTGNEESSGGAQCVGFIRFRGSRLL